MDKAFARKIQALIGSLVVIIEAGDMEKDSVAIIAPIMRDVKNKLEAEIGKVEDFQEYLDAAKEDVVNRWMNDPRVSDSDKATIAAMVEAGDQFLSTTREAMTTNKSVEVTDEHHDPVAMALRNMETAAND